MQPEYSALEIMVLEHIYSLESPPEKSPGKCPSDKNALLFDRAQGFFWTYIPKIFGKYPEIIRLPWLDKSKMLLISQDVPHTKTQLEFIEFKLMGSSPHYAIYLQVKK